jgi:hypothetical protein
MQPIQWVFIVTALTLVFVVFAVNPLQAGIDEAIRETASLQAQRLVSAINLVSSAPDGTIYNFEMPDSKCNVKITDSFVTLTITQVTGIKITQTESIIKTPTTITNGEFDCKTNKILLLRKIGNTLMVG